MTMKEYEGEGWLPDAAEAGRSTGVQSAFAAERTPLTADEITLILGRRPAIAALHWLLTSPELSQATLAALQAGAVRRSIRIRGSDIPLPRYLRLLSRLCSEVAAQTESEQQEQSRADAPHATNLRTVPYGDHVWEGESELGSLGNQLLWPGLAGEGETPPVDGAAALSPRLEDYFLEGDPMIQRLWPRSLGQKATPYVGGADALKHMAEDIAKAKGPTDFIYLANWYCDIELELVPNDRSSSLKNLLFEAARVGVQVRGMFWAGLDPPSVDEFSNSLPATAQAAIAVLGSAFAYVAYEWARAQLKDLFDHWADNRKVNRLAVDYINALASPLLLKADCGAILDDQHRAFGSHHQKLLVLGLGGKLIAYVGGVEYHANRLRVIPDQPGTPLFDTSVRLEGAGAWAAKETFVKRWQAHPNNHRTDPRPALRGDALLRQPSSGGTLAVQMTHTYGEKFPYAIPIQSAGRALANGIRKARQFIYVEDQYFVGPDEMAQAFIDALRAIKGLLAIIAIAADDLVTDAKDIAFRRRQFVRDLVKQFPPDQFMVFERLGDNGLVTGPSAYIHSKVLIVDDEALFIGSVNSFGRSWSHDTEVDVTIVDSKGPGGTQAGSRGWVRDFRCMLWARHLGLDHKSLGDPATGLGIWKAIWNGAVTTDAQVRRFDVSANPPRWGGRVPELVAPLTTDVVLRAIWNAFVDPE